VKFTSALFKSPTPKLYAKDVRREVTKPYRHFLETSDEYIGRLEAMYMEALKNRNEWAIWGLTLRELMGPPILLSLFLAIIGALAWTGVIPPLWR
jgi:hypothetical protein